MNDSYDEENFLSLVKEQEDGMVMENSEKEVVEIDQAMVVCDIYVSGSFNAADEEYGWKFEAYSDGKKLYAKESTGNNPKYISSKQVGGYIVATLQGIDYAIYKGFETVVIHHNYDGLEYWATGEWKTKKEIAKSYAYLIGQKSEKINIEFIKK